MTTALPERAQRIDAKQVAFRPIEFFVHASVNSIADHPQDSPLVKLWLESPCEFRVRAALDFGGSRATRGIDEFLVKILQEVLSNEA